jgi:mono/diheme cytochrome c family protein
MQRAALVATLLVCAAGAAGAASRQSTDMEGRVLYARYCAACHGLEADGRGPVASVLVRPPTDLRWLGDRYGRPLDAGRLARWVDGREEVAAHGPRTMPVWGERFAAPAPEESGRPPAIDPRIRKMVEYLQTLQQRREPE